MVSPVLSYLSGSVVSLADIYQRAAGFGVTGAHNNLSGRIIWAVPNRGHTHLDSDVPHHGSVHCFDTVTNFMGFRHRNIVSVLNADVAQNGLFSFF